jgi:hypothetical protein
VSKLYDASTNASGTSYVSADNNHLFHAIVFGGHRGTANWATFAPFFYHLVVTGAALDALQYMATGAWLRGQFFTISCVAAFLVAITCLAAHCSPWSLAFCSMVSLRNVLDFPRQFTLDPWMRLAQPLDLFSGTIPV